MEAASSTKVTALTLPLLWRSLVVVLGLLFALPASFSYFTIHFTLSHQNVCHVSYSAVTTASSSISSSSSIDSSAAAGTYVPLDNASYYWAKVPYSIRPLLLRASAWSITTLAATVLSPMTRHDREASFRRERQTSEIGSSGRDSSAVMIQWDQSHTASIADRSSQKRQGMMHNYYAAEIPSSSPMDQSHANRWCLIPGQDERVYKNENKSPPNNSRNDEATADMAQSVFGPGGSMMQELAASKEAQKKKHQQQLQNHDTTTGDSSSHYEKHQPQWRICGPLQPSIMTNYDQPPYFVELPLQPPQSGQWHAMMLDTTNENFTDDEDFENPSGQRMYSNNMVDSAYSASIQHFSQQHDVQVQCHMSPQALPHLAKGQLGYNQQQDNGGGDPSRDVKNLWWERAEVLGTDWNPLRLPSTALIMVWVGLSYACRVGLGQRTTLMQGHSWNLVEAIRQHVQHDSFPSLLWTVFWLYILGGGLETTLGSITYLAVHATLVVWLAVWSQGRARNYMWTLFALGVLLSQVRPRLFVGPVEIMSLSIGFVSMNGMPWVIWAGSSILTHKPRRKPRRRRSKRKDRHSSSRTNGSVDSSSQQQEQEEPPDDDIWKYCLAASLVLGWILSNRLALEVLASPQWTIPSVLAAHLWWLQRQSGTSKRDDSEHLRLLHPEVLDGDDSTSIYSIDTEVVDDSSLQLLRHEYREAPELVAGVFPSMSEAVLALILSSMALLSGVMLDASLAVGHVLVTVFYVGAQYHSNRYYEARQHDNCSHWCLYHMVGACVLVVIDVMTLAGWILCHVLMAVPGHYYSSIAAWVPTYWLVGSMVMGQCLAHFAALLVTAISSSHLDWSADMSSPPGHSFWRHVQVVGEEARLWSYIFS